MMQSFMGICLFTLTTQIFLELSSGAMEMVDISGTCERNYEGPSVSCFPAFRSPTCQGHCGNVTTLFPYPQKNRDNIRGLSCSCDKACLVYGDCCRDIQAACPSEYDAAVNLKKKTGDVDTTCVGQTSSSNRLVITSCPTTWTGQSIREKCQSFLDIAPSQVTSVQDFMLLSPVEDLSTGLHYRNKYCAQCNNITEALSWRSSFLCYDFDASVVSLPYVLNNFETYNCREFHWLHPTSRDCMGTSVDSCPGSCNNTALVEKCLSYQSIVETSGATFRNIDCASCNLQVKDSDIYEKYNSTIEVFCQLPRVPDTGFHSISFSVIFSLKEEQEEVDIWYGSQPELLLSDLQYKSRQLCQNDQQCSITQCSPGFVMTPDGCEARTGYVEFVLQLSLLPIDDVFFTAFELETVEIRELAFRVKAANNSSLDVLTHFTSSEIAIHSSQNKTVRHCLHVANNTHGLENTTKVFLYVVLYDMFDPLNNSAESRNKRVESFIVSMLNSTVRIQSANWYSVSWPYAFCHGNRFGTSVQKCTTSTFSTSSFNVTGNRTLELVSDSYESQNFSYDDVIFAEDMISVCQDNVTLRITEKLSGEEFALTVLTFAVLGLSAMALIIRLAIQLVVPSYHTRAGLMQSLYAGALLTFTLVYLTTLAVFTVRGPDDFAVSILTIFSFFFFTLVYCSLNALCVNVYIVLSNPFKAKDRSATRTTSTFLLHSFLPSVIILITCLCLEFVSGVPFSWQPLFAFCGPWICQRNPHIIFFVVPFGISIISNISLFIATSILIKRSTDRQEQMTSRSSSSRRNQIIFRLSVMMGMVWVFGIIDIFFNNIVIEFITTILIAGQGLFFVIISVHKKTWQSMRKSLNNLRGNSKPLYTVKASSSL